MVTQGSVLQTANIELASGENLYQLLIFFTEEVETSVGPLVLDDRLRQLAQFLHPSARIGEGGDEFQVAVVGGTQGLAQGGQAVEALLQVRPLGDARSIALFYLAVVREKGDIIDGGLDPQDETELVVQLQAHRSHGVFDPSPWDAEVEAIPEFILIIAVQFLTQEGGHV